MRLVDRLDRLTVIAWILAIVVAGSVGYWLGTVDFSAWLEIGILGGVTGLAAFVARNVSFIFRRK
jgi:hypothetical protein